MRSAILILSALVLAYWPAAAHAYIGPGLGLGAIGAILGVILSVLLALTALFWYPLKRLFGRKKKTAAEEGGEREGDA